MKKQTITASIEQFIKIHNLLDIRSSKLMSNFKFDSTFSYWLARLKKTINPIVRSVTDQLSDNNEESKKILEELGKNQDSVEFIKFDMNSFINGDNKIIIGILDILSPFIKFEEFGVSEVGLSKKEFDNLYELFFSNQVNDILMPVKTIFKLKQCKDIINNKNVASSDTIVIKMPFFSLKDFEDTNMNLIFFEVLDPIMNHES